MGLFHRSFGFGIRIVPHAMPLFVEGDRYEIIAKSIATSVPMIFKKKGSKIWLYCKGLKKKPRHTALPRYAGESS